LRGKGGVARPYRSGPSLTRPTAPDPLPAWGRVRRRHVSLKKGSSVPTAEARTPIGVRGLLRPSGRPHHVGVRNRHVSRGRGIVRESSAGGLAHPPHLMWWTRRALPPRYVRQPLSGLAEHRVLPRSTVQPPVPHPRRARLHH